MKFANQNGFFSMLDKCLELDKTARLRMPRTLDGNVKMERIEKLRTEI